MSYILGALKKADQERRRESDVKIAGWDQDSWDDPTPSDNTSRWLIGLATVGLVFVLAVFGFVAFRVLESVPQSQPVSVVENNPSALKTALRDVSPSIAREEQTNEAIAGSRPVDRAEEVPGEQLEETVDVAEQPESDGLPEFSGHLYFPGNPGMSRVFANASSYREGELINGYRIEQILEEEVLLRKDGEEMRIGLRN